MKRKSNKYHSRKVTVDGVTYDSIKEYRRYCELKLLEKAGQITDLQRQVPFELIPSQYETFERYGKKGQRLKDGKRCVEQAILYIADFVYTENGETVVEDVKGYKEGIAYQYFVIKRKLMLYVHKIRIKEV